MKGKATESLPVELNKLLGEINNLHGICNTRIKYSITPLIDKDTGEIGYRVDRNFYDKGNNKISDSVVVGCDEAMFIFLSGIREGLASLLLVDNNEELPDNKDLN